MDRAILTRVASAAVALPVALALIHTGGWVFGGLIIVVTTICMREFVVMAVPGDRVLQIVVTAAGVALVPLAMTGTLATPAGLLAPSLGLVAVLLAFLFRPGDIETVAPRMGLAVTGIAWAGGLMAMIGCLRLLPDGDAWIYLACTLAWASDTGGYFAGRFLGKRKLYPRVSPKKTWMGSFGGVVAATAGAYLLCWLLGAPSIDPVHLAILAPIVTVIGQMGDLSESLLKRSTGVKDSGSIMPGHGGLLDRVDALLFVVPCLMGYAMIVLELTPRWL